MNVIQMVTMIENKELKSVGLSFCVGNVWGIPQLGFYSCERCYNMKKFKGEMNGG